MIDIVFLLQIMIFRLWIRKEKNIYHQFIDRMFLSLKKNCNGTCFMSITTKLLGRISRENNQWGIYYFIKHSGAVQIESWCFEHTGTGVQAEIFSNNCDIIQFFVKTALAVVHKTWLFSRQDNNSAQQVREYQVNYVVYNILGRCLTNHVFSMKLWVSQMINTQYPMQTYIGFYKFTMHHQHSINLICFRILLSIINDSSIITKWWQLGTLIATTQNLFLTSHWLS